MIMGLSVACGPDYIRSLGHMLQDIKDSECFNEEFNQFVRNPKEAFGFDFNVQVMTSGSWSFHELISFHLSEELKQVVQNFTAFYYYGNTDRKLQWLHNRSFGVVVVNCFQEPYTLAVSTYQMAVLLMCNFVDRFTFQQPEETSINMDNLRDVLQFLLN
ncbi:hypothetical protein HPB48_006882 [Haemaphysalis longicornis]|uniref:Cullin family profile domain-containing protein n=1 Tax=Haemaphysalis longicornis TaxID=44386 RepID=A0A9J6FG50_HAELO|nr:hypothetical protein HPB48_006882 [Haemaphysalis longicornis]